MPKAIEPPANFAELVAKFADTQIAAQIGVHPNTIKKWRAKRGLKREVPYGIPDNIEELARTMSINALRRHLGWPDNDSFRQKLAAQYPRAYALAKHNGERSRGSAAAETNRKRAKQRREESPPPPPPPKPQVVAKWSPPVKKVTLAMNHLRRFGPCYPLSVRYPERSGYWFYGREWTDEELITEAKRRGWVPLDEMELA